MKGNADPACADPCQDWPLGVVSKVPFLLSVFRLMLCHDSVGGL